MRQFVALREFPLFAELALAVHLENFASSQSKGENHAKKPPSQGPFAVSSFNGAIYPEGHKTGVFFVEALHPYEVLTAAGFEVNLASETGTFGFDKISLTPPFLSGSEHAILNNPKHPFMVKIESQLKKASDLKKEEYGFFFASAGHSALYDYPTAKAYRQSLQCWAGDRAG